MVQASGNEATHHRESKQSACIPKKCPHTYPTTHSLNQSRPFGFDGDLNQIKFRVASSAKMGGLWCLWKGGPSLEGYSVAISNQVTEYSSREGPPSLVSLVSLEAFQSSTIFADECSNTTTVYLLLSTEQNQTHSQLKPRSQSQSQK